MNSEWHEEHETLAAMHENHRLAAVGFGEDGRVYIILPDGHRADFAPKGAEDFAAALLEAARKARAL